MERRSDEVNELPRIRESEGYAVRDDESPQRFSGTARGADDHIAP